MRLSEPAEGDPAAAEAILAAAAELFTTTNPSKVTLRAVAARAGVNYGLIHRHFRTKDSLVAALFRRLTAYGTSHIRRSADAAAATASLHRASAGGFASLFASVALDGADPTGLFGDHSAIDAYAARIAAQWAADHPGVEAPFDARSIAGFLMLNILTFDLYAPYVQALVDADRPLPELRDEHLRILQRCITALGPSGE